LDLLLGIIIIQVLMLTFTFKKLPRWNRWVRQFSYILKSGIGMRVWQHGSATACNFKDVAFTDDSRFTDARTPLSHSLLSHTAITIAQLSTLVSDATLISSTDSRL
jgi:hypothetical protein